MRSTIIKLLLLALALSVHHKLAIAAGLYTAGHADIRAYYESGELKLRFRLDGHAIVDELPVDPVFESTPAPFEFSELVVNVPGAPLEMTTDLLNSQPELAVLGAAAGDFLWYLPQTQEGDRPWLGFSTEELSGSDWMHPVGGATGLLRLDFLAVAGPAGAHFSLLDNVDPGLPTNIHFASMDGIDANDSYRSGLAEPALSASAHAHVNWMFTQPGIYDVTLRLSGIHAVDGYREAIGVVRFAVATPVPEPTTLGLTLIAAPALWWLRRRKPLLRTCRGGMDGSASRS